MIIDACVWSLLFRRPKITSPHATELSRLILTRQARMCGPVRQELLSGVRLRTHFELLRDQVSSFPDYPLLREHFEVAAECCNTCSKQGIQGSSTDFLLCAISLRDGLAVYTVDSDFLRYARHINIKLYKHTF